MSVEKSIVQINDEYHDLEQQVRNMIKPFLVLEPRSDHVVDHLFAVGSVEKKIELFHLIKETCKTIHKLRLSLVDELGSKFGHTYYAEMYLIFYLHVDDVFATKENQEKRFKMRQEEEAKRLEELKKDPWYNP